MKLYGNIEYIKGRLSGKLFSKATV